MSWTLQEQFVMSQLNRLDHPHYFQEDFICDDLDTFFMETLTDGKKIWKKRKILNHFFDRLFNMNIFCVEKQHEQQSKKRCFYIRMKWIIYLHHLIQTTYLNKESLYQFTLKGLHIFIEDLTKNEGDFGPFQQHLNIHLLKPYIQYLSKVCLLEIKMDEELKNDQNSTSKKNFIQQNDKIFKIEEEDKQNQNIFANLQERNSNIHDATTSQASFFNLRSPIKLNQKKSEKQGFICETRSNSNSSHQELSPIKKEVPAEISVRWYREYNHIIEALETLQRPLEDSKTFFELNFPFLNNISKLLIKDFKKKISDLKKTYSIFGEGLLVTPLQMDYLQTKIGKFSLQATPDIDNYSEMVGSEIHELRKQKIAGFMSSAEKKEKTWGSERKPQQTSNQCMSISTFLID